MKKLLLFTGIYGGIAAIAFGTAFGVQYKPSSNDVDAPALNDTERVVTDKQKMLNSLLAIKGFEVDGNINIFTVDNNVVEIDLEGNGDLSDFSNIKVDANIDVNINETHLKAGFGYFDSEIYLDVLDSKFFLETNCMMDFIELLPTYGFNIQVPDSIKELNLSDIENLVENDLSDKKVTPDGQNFYFEYTLTDNSIIKILTDLDLNFCGVKSEHIDFKGTLFSFDVKLNRLDEVILNKPVRSEYRDFKPFFTLFDGLYNLTKMRKNDIVVDLNIDKYVEDEEGVETKTNFFSTKLDLIYDLESENHVYALKGKLDINNNVTNYDFALTNNNIYAHYGDIALSISNENLTNLLEYILLKIGSDKITSLLSGLVSTTSQTSTTDIIEKASNAFGPIELDTNSLALNLNLNGITDKVDLSDVKIILNFSGEMGTGKFESLVINDLRVNNFEADVKLSLGEYKGYSIADIDYQKLDYLLPLIDAYEKYATQDQFRIEFDAKVSQEEQNDITIDGGLQFELDPLRGEEGHTNVGYGYGNVDIVDRKGVKHSIYADMKDVDKVLLRYNTTIGDIKRDSETDPMYAKMKVQTLKDVAGMATDLINNPDEHFNELFGALLNSSGSLPIKDIIGGDYTKLLSTNIVDRLVITENSLEADIALDIVNFDGVTFTVRVEFDGSYDSYMDGTYGLKALKISNLNYEGYDIEFNAYLKDFDPSLESSRLSEYESYLDFSDLKVLLRLGINTSKNNYYKFSGTADIKFALGSINIPLEEIGLDIRVWTLKGDVKVSIDIANVPLISDIAVIGGAAAVFGYHNDNESYDETISRSAGIYYHDKNFYVKRIDEVYNKEGGFLGIGSKKVYYTETLAAKYTLDYFFDNVVNILCSDVLELSSKVMEKITESMSSTDNENYQMKYENILTDFAYSASGHYFLFTINLAEISNNTQLSDLNLKVMTDSSNTSLTGLTLNLGISLLGSIGITLSATINLDDSALVANDSNKITTLENWLAVHETDEVDSEGKYISLSAVKK